MPLLLLTLPPSACAPTDASLIVEESVQATLNETVRSIVTVTWEAAGVSAVSVEYGKTNEYGYTTPEQATTASAHAVPLYGLAIDTTYHFRVVVVAGGERVVGEDHVVVTGTPDPALREVALVQADPARWSSWVLTTVAGISPPADVVILSPEAEPVWYWHVEGGHVFHALMGERRDEVSLLVEGLSDATAHRVDRVSIDGALLASIPTPRGHHDLVRVPGLQFAYLAANPRTVGEEIVYGDIIVEVHEDGTQVRAWDTFDHLDVTEHEGWDYPYYPDGRDWTHANGLLYDEAEDAWYLSLYWLNQVLKIDRATGQILWTLGGDASDFTLVDDDGFGPQHGLALVDGDLLLFDNATGEDGGSRLVRYELDTDAWTARRVWSWSRAPLVAGTLGDVNPLPDGTILSSWGDAGAMIALSPEDEVVFELDHEPATLLGQVEVFASPYPD